MLIFTIVSSVCIPPFVPPVQANPDVQTAIYYPSGDGSYTQFGYLYPSSPSTHYDKVDETPNDGDSTYIATGDSSLYKIDSFTFTHDLSGVTIHNITVVITVRSTHSSYKGYAYQALIIDGTVYTSSTYVRPDASYIEYSYTWTVNPATGEAWQLSDLNNLEFGIKAKSYYYASLHIYFYVRCTQVRIEIAYEADVTSPTINELICAGNPNEPAFGTDTNNIYYRNGTIQTENWIYIKVNVTDDVAVDTVLCEWYNGTWQNLTMTSLGDDLYAINITGQNYATCTFNIYANDTSGNWAKYVWTFYDYEDSWGTEEEWRKYIGLNGVPESLSYKQFYFTEPMYYDYAGDFVRDRWLPHEQPCDTGGYDTAIARYDQPDDYYEIQCSAYVGIFIDETLTIQNTTIDNIYFHIWWNTGNGTINLGYEKENDSELYRDFDEYYTTDSTKSRQEVNVTGFTYDTYYLEARLWDINDPTFIDNDINLFAVKGEAPPGTSGISFISTPSYCTFFIINLPDNATLQGMDTDNDGLSDYEELFVYWTDPRDPDTDSGGEPDKSEIDNGRNPLVPSDDQEIKPIASNIGAEPNVVGQPCTFHAYWSDYFGLSTAMFYWNATGAWQLNGTITFPANTLEAWSNFTRTLPNQPDITIAWYIICNNTYGSWGNTSVQILVLAEWHVLVYDFSLNTRKWSELAFNFTLNVMKWNPLSYSFSLDVLQWHSMTFPFDLSALAWHSLTFPFQLIAMQWHQLSYIYDLTVYGWHQLTFPFTVDTMQWNMLPYDFVAQTRQWNTLGFPFTLLKWGEWHSLAYLLNLQTLQWHELAYFFNLTVLQWHHTIYPFTLNTMQWNILNYAFQAATMIWHTLTFPFTLLPWQMWHSLSYQFTLWLEGAPINWGLIALCVAMLAFVLATSTIATKRD